MMARATPNLLDTIAYLPRGRRSGWLVAAGLLMSVLGIFFAVPAAALFLRLATLLLPVALVAGLIACAALWIGAAPARRRV